MKIAIVTETCAPEVNGVAMTLGRLMSCLRERGHRLQLVRPERPGLPAPDALELRVPGVAIPGYPELRFGLPAYLRLRRQWRQRAPELVHIVTEGPLGYAALCAARELGIPVSSGFHTHFDQYSGYYGVPLLRRAIGAYLRHFHNRAGCTLAPGRQTCDALVTRGYRNVIQLDRGVDTQLFNPARRCEALRSAWRAREGAPVAICVGRVAPEKNPVLLLRAHAELRRHHPLARLVVVGDGPERAALQRAHPEVIFSGTRSGEDLARHYASADLFLFPSLTETWGNVVVEAMASGLPVLAFDCAAAGQLVQHGHSGLLAPSGDEAAFLSLLEQLPPAAALRTWGERARQRCQGMSWEAIADTMEHVFHRLSAGPLNCAGALP